MGQVAAEVDEGFQLHRCGEGSSSESGKDLAGRLHAALRPPSLLDQERPSGWGELGRHPHLFQEREAPAGHLGPVADVQVLGEGVEVPASRILQGLPSPQPGRAVEVEEAPSPVPPRLLEEEVAVQKQRLSPGQPGVGLVQVVPAGLDHPHARVRHRGQQSAEQVRPGQEVGVEDQEEIARGSSQPSGQRTCLEAFADGSPKHRHVHPASAPEAGSSLGEGRGLVRGVVEDLDLKAVAGVGQAAGRVDQPLHHAALVEDGQLDGHAGRGLAFRCRRVGCGHGVSWRHGGRCRRRWRQASPRKQQQKRSVAGERQQQSQHDAVGGDDSYGERVRHGRAAKPRQRRTGRVGYLGNDGSS